MGENWVWSKQMIDFIRTEKININTDIHDTQIDIYIRLIFNNFLFTIAREVIIQTGSLSIQVCRARSCKDCRLQLINSYGTRFESMMVENGMDK